MKTNELRIGNYLALPMRGEDVVIVEEILADEFVVCNVTTNEWPITDYAPILLTDEWLLRFGFNEDHYGDYYREYNINPDKHFHSYFELTQMSNKSYQIREYDIYIAYVHQLQNLYFALTGEELTLKQ